MQSTSQKRPSRTAGWLQIFITALALCALLAFTANQFLILSQLKSKTLTYIEDSSATCYIYRGNISCVPTIAADDASTHSAPATTNYAQVLTP
ncbi:hypothetical protein ABMC30_03130 [Comamonas kerstersii]